MVTTKNKMTRTEQQLCAALTICLSIKTLCRCPDCQDIVPGLKDPRKAYSHGSFLLMKKDSLMTNFKNHREIINAIQQVFLDSREHCQCDKEGR